MARDPVPWLPEEHDTKHAHTPGCCHDCANGRTVHPREFESQPSDPACDNAGCDREEET